MPLFVKFLAILYDTIQWQIFNCLKFDIKTPNQNIIRKYLNTGLAKVLLK